MQWIDIFVLFIEYHKECWYQGDICLYMVQKFGVFTKIHLIKIYYMKMTISYFNSHFLNKVNNSINNEDWPNKHDTWLWPSNPSLHCIYGWCGYNDEKKKTFLHINYRRNSSVLLLSASYRRRICAYMRSRFNIQSTPFQKRQNVVSESWGR